MVFCSTTDIRKVTNLSTLDVSDSDLLYYATIATNMFVEDISIPIVDEEMTGDIDGTNTTFSVDHYPLSNRSGNTFSVINSLDVTVYAWTDEDDPTTKTEFSVSTLYPQYGTIVLASSPSTAYETMTCDYRYCFTDTINPSLATIAVAYLAGFLAIVREFMLMPESYAHGALRFKQGDPARNCYDKYSLFMNMIKSKDWVLTDSEAADIYRKELG